ncbi:MAG: M50 family metallopeptidase [Myxococcota bacterium]
MGLALSVLAVVLAALFVGLLIIIHEAGHYFAALWGGMRVNRFSIGFGPVLFRSRRGETDFQVAAIPLGGFVEVAGLQEDDGTDSSDPRSYQNRSFMERFNMVLAGPAANYAAALLILWAYFGAFNVQFTGPFRVVAVVPDSAAAEGGLKANDVIVGSPNGEFADRKAVLQAIQDSGGDPLRLKILRDGQPEVISVRPRPAGSGFRLGIQFEETAGVTEPLGFSAGFSRATQSIWDQSKGLLSVFSRLFTRPSEVSGSLSGPIGIVQQLARAIESAPMAAMATVGALSVALGLFNLLPIPALDGSRLLFLLIGAIRRRPVPAKLENTVHAVGLLLLMGVLLLVSWNDVMRWLSG